MEPPPTLLQRVKQRKVVQWALAYLGAAWLLLQVTAILSQTFAWPPFVARVVAVLLGVGLLAVLVVAWYHGERGQQRVSGVEALLLGGVLLLAGTAVAVVRSGSEDPAAPTPAAVPAPAAEAGSVAVLPFVNMSADPEQEYFSDGLTEEILNVLAQLPDLRVAARTSAFVFKDARVPVDSIGRALHVAHVVEGSVRKAGPRVRITAQLVNAETGYHLWSATYDREVGDLFAVQDEIARAIAEALRLRLPGGSGAVLAAEETADPMAYELLLRGLQASRQAEASVRLDSSSAFFRRALARDPGYARAHAELANVLAFQGYERRVPPEAAYAEARAEAEHALALAPDLPAAHAVLGWLANFVAWDFAAAEAHYRRALEGSPANARAYSMHAWLLMRLGHPAEAVAEAERAVALDPLSAGVRNNLGSMYIYAGQPERAAETYRAALALSPSPTSKANLALAEAALGRFDEGIRYAREARAEDDVDPFHLAVLGYLYARAGRRAEAAQALDALAAAADVPPFLLAMVHVGLGDADAAFAQLDRGLEARDEYLPDVGVEPAFAPLRGDPRFRRLLARIGLA